ncbi:hypothetical protein [Actinoalloteichus hymeniacidonis]|uniref:Uncharacterized protein n=1 Tax=Actinoalloteichus hymeniacidonis TaxID=340345 RepID=A0AAC9MXQ7_9PSEU|nr:hypothetical protein [Actinoalloteichus hymeniacidonis]AOS62192.1 hypothetical protein TL08_06850 [Actinoalloteichus hymeniacidonis]MBB5909783.1 cadmium resistance protein CadD (predicted permease) [Actinoalloteichus hymeniacidonis]
MLLFVRVALFVGAAVIVVAVAAAATLRGVEFASWVAGSFGALTMATGLVMQARRSRSNNSEAPRDRIEQRHVKAGGRIIGKSGGSGGGDNILQERLDAGGDVIGKQAAPELDR